MIARNKKQKAAYLLGYLGALALFFGLAGAWFLYGYSFEHRQNPPLTKSGQPMVLGAVSAPLRGAPEPQKLVLFKQTGDPELAKVTAKSFLVYDGLTGQVLFSRNPSQKMGIASLTKLLTAYTAYQVLDLNSKIEIPTTETGSNTNPSLKIVPGDKIKTLNLFDAMLVGSENDAAGILAKEIRTVSGTSTIGLMNQVAGELGMANSHFGNPYGFDFGNNHSTAEDLKKLVDATQKLHAFVSLENKTGYGFRSLLGNTYFAKATNRLVGKVKNIYAIKTGFTESSLGSMAIKTYISDRPVIVILLGSQAREADALCLKEEAEKHFVLEK